MQCNKLSIDMLNLRQFGMFVIIFHFHVIYLNKHLDPDSKWPLGFVYNAFLSFPHLFLIIHTFILSLCGGFFVISHGLGPVPLFWFSILHCCTHCVDITADWMSFPSGKTNSSFVNHLKTFHSSSLSLLASTHTVQYSAFLCQITLPHWPWCSLCLVTHWCKTC